MSPNSQRQFAFTEFPYETCICIQAAGQNTSSKCYLNYSLGRRNCDFVLRCKKFKRICPGSRNNSSDLQKASVGLTYVPHCKNMKMKEKRKTNQKRDREKCVCVSVCFAVLLFERVRVSFSEPSLILKTFSIPYKILLLLYT